MPLKWSLLLGTFVLISCSSVEAAVTGEFRSQPGHIKYLPDSNLAFVPVGRACKVTDTMPGICRTSSDCEPLIDGYIKSGVLTLNDVPSCGLGAWGEIFCCPTKPCCDNR